MKTHLLTSHAIIDIDGPERWAKQLVSHLSRKASLDRTVDSDVLTIGTGHGVVSVQQDRLVLRAAAPDAESLFADTLRGGAAAQALSISQSNLVNLPGPTMFKFLEPTGPSNAGVVLML